MDYRDMAERRLNERRDVFEKYKTANSQGKTDLAREYERQMDRLAAEAREYVEAGEKDSEIRSLLSTEDGKRMAGAVDRGLSVEDGDEWRGLLPGRSEIRDMETRAENGAEYLMPNGTAAKFVDLLRNKAVFLKGIPAENLLAFEDRKWVLPVLSDSDMPVLVAENALITEGDDDWQGLEFDAKKYADYRTVGNETLADASLNLRNVLAQTMVKNCAAAFDADAFAGQGPAGGTPSPVLGLIGQGVTTEAGSTSGDLPTFDGIADCIGRIWTGNGEPSVIWAAPDAAIALAKEREGSDGNYVADAESAVGLARRLPTLISTSLPAGHVVVADGSRIFAGRREDVRVAVSEHAHFQNDKVALRLTMRAAGVYVVESSSVQVLTQRA